MEPTSPNWYYSRLSGPPGEQSGPVAWEHLVSYARSGYLTPDDLVFGPQSTTWRRAVEIPGLFSGVTPAANGYLSAAYAPPPAGVAPERRRSSRLRWLVPLIVVILAGAGLGAYFGVWYHKDLRDLETLAFAQKAGEIFLEPAGAAGPGSFTGEQFVTATPTTTLDIPNPAVTLPPLSTTSTSLSTASTEEELTTPPATASKVAVVAAYSGDTPALYGGSKSKLIADKDKELLFLEQNPLKAAAFCEALNSDPTLRWSGGNQVRPDQLPDYFAELTPLLLTHDTRVTNYGYRNGHPTPRQSVLQAGQYVLVDRYGVPRKRCECGNPLTPPIASRVPPVYTGSGWSGFNPGNVIIVQQTNVVINNFTVIDINSGQTFGRPSGTSGTSDGAPPSMGENYGTGPAPGEESSTSTTGSSTQTTAVPGPRHSALSSTGTGWFGEGNGSASDGRNGQAVGNVTYPQGVIGQAFGFDGSSYIEVPDGPDLTLGSSAFTIALWVYFDTVQDRDPFIAHDEGGGQTNKWIFWFDRAGHDRLKGQGALRFHVNIPGQSTTDAIAAPWDPQPSTWYYVAVTHVPGEFRLYINGDLVATQANDIVIPDPSAPLTIGRAESFFHTGRLDEVELWHSALSDGAIKTMYEQAMQGSSETQPLPNPTP